MKEKKIKKETNKKKNMLDFYAIYKFPYYSGNVKNFWAYPIKALLSCLTAAFGIAYLAQLLDFKGGNFFAQLFGIEKGIFSFAAAAFISCGIYFVLLGFFKCLPVAAFTAGGFGLYCLWGVKSLGLAEDAKAFIIKYIRTASGDFVNTDSFGASAYADKSGAMDFMVLVSIAFGMIFAFSVAKRFHPDFIVISAAVMAVPAFLSRTARFYPSLVIFIAGLLGLWAMNQSMGANIILGSGGAANMRMDDREYRKSVKGLSPTARIVTDGKRYSMHLSDAVVIFIISAVAMSIAASSFPLEGSIKMDKALQAVIQWGQGVGEHFSGVFADLNFKLGGKSYLNGFFSADGNSINISNNINPNSVNRDGHPVLEVITENKDKLYLRGDIGYQFDGDNWKSISEINYSELKYSGAGSSSLWDGLYGEDSSSLWGGLYGEEGGEGGEIYVSEILEKYIPEIQTLYAKNISSYAGNSFIGMETVKIDYLKNMNTVLFPGTPFVYNFRENGNFKVYGDFVATSEGRRINSMETGVLYINEPVTLNEDYYDDYVFTQLDTGLTFPEYKSYANAYSRFVNDYYTQISEQYEQIISSFAQKCLEGVREEYWFSSDIWDRFELKIRYCDAVMNYLNSGRYKYSLTADNFSGNNDPMYNFLYNTREGHCAMYATAMCLTLRYCGIPARYVTGFTLGGDRCEKTKDNHYKYTLTDKDLHAWVEVYYEGLGWVPYDPTPGSLRNIGNVTPPVTQATTTAPETDVTTAAPPVTTAAETAVTTAAATDQSSGNNTAVTASTTENAPDTPAVDPETVRIIFTVLGIIFILFIVFMSVLGLYKGLERKERELLGFFKKGEPTKAVKMMLPFMLKLLKMRGIVRIKGETPEEFGIRADSQLEIGSAVVNTIPVFEKSEFDKNPVFDSEEQQAAYECITDLLKYTLDGMNGPGRLAARIKLFGKKQVNPKK